MKAWELAAQWHDKHCPNERLIEAVARCMAGGMVYSTDGLLVLGYEAHWDDEQKQLTDGPLNAWVCHLAAGVGIGNPVAAVMRVVPHKREFAVWQRNNDGRWRARRWDYLEQRFNNKGEH